MPTLLVESFGRRYIFIVVAKGLSTNPVVGVHGWKNPKLYLPTAMLMECWPIIVIAHGVLVFPIKGARNPHELVGIRRILQVWIASTGRLLRARFAIVRASGPYRQTRTRNTNEPVRIRGILQVRMSSAARRTR